MASRAAVRVVERILTSDNGMVKGQPRIFNVDTGTYSLGYVEINSQATSTFSRIKSHKAWFSGSADVQDGSHIIDRATGYHYLVMSAVPEFSGGEPAYIDGTLYYANMKCRLERFTLGARDACGRAVIGDPEVIDNEVYVMTQSITLNVTQSKDQNVADEKFKLAVQRKYDIRVNDRFVSQNGYAYKVNSVDETQLDGLWMLNVGRDIR